jgi:hypothetical protein
VDLNVAGSNPVARPIFMSDRKKVLLFAKVFLVSWRCVDMKRSIKPVRKCHSCLLNLDDHCWKYSSPRDQWKDRACSGFENEEIYAQFREWEKQPDIKTRKELRRESFRSRGKKGPNMHDMTDRPAKGRSR